MSAICRLALKIVDLVAIRSVAGPPQDGSAPSGGREDTKCRAWGPYSDAASQLGRLAGVTARRHGQQAGFLMLGDVQPGDETLPQFARHGLTTGEFFELLVGLG